MMNFDYVVLTILMLNNVFVLSLGGLLESPSFKRAVARRVAKVSYMQQLMLLTSPFDNDLICAHMQIFGPTFQSEACAEMYKHWLYRRRLHGAPLLRRLAMIQEGEDK